MAFILQPQTDAPTSRPGGVRQFPPADYGTQRLAPLTPEELESCLSSPAWTRGVPCSHETNPELYFRGVGVYPRPGLYESARRKDPVIMASLARHTQYLQSLEWRLTEPPDATPEEIEAAAFVRDCLWSMGPAGFGGLLRQISERNTFGFTVLETVWNVVNERWRLEACVYLYPNSIAKWITNPSGHLLGVLQRGERGLVAIPVEKLAHFAVGFTGTNYVGISRLRSVLWSAEYKADSLLRRAQSEAIFGAGFLDVVTNQPRESKERAALESQLDLWSDAELRYLVHDEGTTITPSFGGSVLPDMSALTHLNHEISAGLDGGLHELGMSQQGSRAVGSEMRASTHESLAGEARELAHLITTQLVQPIMSVNGWTARGLRSPIITTRGAGSVSKDDTDRARLMLEMVRDGVVPPGQEDAVTARAMELLDL